MSFTNEFYDSPDTILEGTIRLGDIIRMDCWNHIPAVIIKSQETRDPDTEEEYEKYGRHVPVEQDIQIGCPEYQRIARLPLHIPIQACDDCPLKRTTASSI